jgi:hypothetical protein
LQLTVERIDIRDEHVKGAVAGLAFGLTGGLQVDEHAVSFHTRVERRLPVGELRVKAEHLAIMLDAAQDVLNDKYGCGSDERNLGWAGHWNLHRIGGVVNAKSCILIYRNESSSEEYAAMARGTPKESRV